jgi:adenylate cyclase class IV
MPLNIEIKARGSDPDRLRLLAEAVSDIPPERIEQVDTFFACPRGRLKLRQFSGDAGELIYYSRADVAGTKQSDYSIAQISSPAILLSVLSAALEVTGTVMKTRVLLRSGQTRIHLDSVRGLGFFVELEVVLRDGQPTEEGHAIARELMRSLEISDCDLIEGAYVDLLSSEA